MTGTSAMSTDGYELIGRVSPSGHRTVWQARDRQRGQLVAVKEIGSPAIDVAMVRHGALRLAALVHPAVVGVHDLVELSDRLWVVEDWINGAPLSEVTARVGPLGAQQAILLMRGALDGLAYLHRQGVVHGDISPANVLLDLAGMTRLIDIDSSLLLSAGRPDRTDPVARDSAAAADSDDARGASGPGGYRSPERRCGEPGGRRSDVWSISAVLADLITGSPSTIGQARRLIGIVSPIAAVLRKGMDPDPARRQADAGALVSELELAAERAFGVWWWQVVVVGSSVTAAVTAGLATVIADTGLLDAAGVPVTGFSTSLVIPSDTVRPRGAAGDRKVPWWQTVGFTTGASLLVAIGLTAVTVTGTR